MSTMEPPSYAFATNTTPNSPVPSSSNEAITYSFLRHSPNSMILSAGDISQARYLITIDLNPFMPASFVTSIYRGGVEDEGTFVGDFESGISSLPETIFLRGAESKVQSAIQRSGNSQFGTYAWILANENLRWDCKVNPRICTIASNQRIIAKFTVTTAPRNRRSNDLGYKLTVYPEGQAFFDDLLMSVLIIERNRLTPTPTTNRGTKSILSEHLVNNIVGK